MAGSVSRVAGPKLAATGTRLASQFKGLTPKEAALLFGPDVASGVIAGAATPGDVLDKVTVCTGATVGGVVGGAAGRSLIRPGKPIGALGYLTDMAGSTAGDMAGYRAAEGVVRARNGGLTPAEVEAIQYDEQLRQQAIIDYLTGR